jgi:uncharacterized protein (DUF697 family)
MVLRRGSKSALGRSNEVGLHEPEILKHVGAAMAAAATPLPLVDIAAVAVIQVALVRRLARRYGVEYDVARGRAALLAVAGASLARVGASVKSLPGGGWLLGSATQAALSEASTYALGETILRFFFHSATIGFDLLRSPRHQRKSDGSSASC